VASSTHKPNPGSGSDATRGRGCGRVAHGTAHAGRGGDDREAGGDRGAAAGLVQPKTTFQTGDKIPFSLSKPDCNLRRIKRLRTHLSAASRVMGLADPGFRAMVPWMVTLTYADDAKWASGHIAGAMQAFRHWHRKKGLGEAVRAVRVAELTKRGRVHYHLVIWLPPGVSMPHWDRDQSNRARFWCHGSTKSERLRSHVGYLMKYLSKMGEFHEFPKGLRAYGVSGLSTCARSVRAWYGMPEWVRRSYGVGEVRRIKGRLVVMDTGEVLPAMFSAKLEGGGLVLTLLRPYPERFHDGPFSTWEVSNGKGNS
jgi:hypothetical protein